MGECGVGWGSAEVGAHGERLPIVGCRASYLVSRPEGWVLVSPFGERRMGCRILTEAAVRDALGQGYQLFADHIRFFS
jgi:hypothetical protein